jgi:hypothetical protein
VECRVRRIVVVIVFVIVVGFCLFLRPPTIATEITIMIAPSILVSACCYDKKEPTCVDTFSTVGYT